MASYLAPEQPRVAPNAVVVTITLALGMRVVLIAAAGRSGSRFAVLPRGQ